LTRTEVAHVDLDMTRSSWKVKVHSHRRKKIAKVVDTASSDGFSSAI